MFFFEVKRKTSKTPKRERTDFVNVCKSVSMLEKELRQLAIKDQKLRATRPKSEYVIVISKTHLNLSFPISSVGSHKHFSVDSPQTFSKVLFSFLPQLILSRFQMTCRFCWIDGLLRNCFQTFCRVSSNRRIASTVNETFFRCFETVQF